VTDPGEQRVAAAIVLAAGVGSRMKSTTPKVLHELCGRTMLGHVIGALRGVEPAQLVVVTGQGREQVESQLGEIDPLGVAVFQPVQNGTGHAVRIALTALDDMAAAHGAPQVDGIVVIAPGDTPLLSAASVNALAARLGASGAAAALLIARVPDPTGYGRIIRDERGRVTKIVEQADATEAERAVTEVNSSVYAFDAGKLRTALTNLTTDNAQGEEYLPDVVRILVSSGDAIEAVLVDDWHEIAGVNDRVQLAQARALLRDRIVTRHMRDGVTLIDPATTWVDVDVVLEPDCVVLPNTMLLGHTQIATGARVGPNCELRNTVVGAGAVVRDATCDGAQIGPQASVGPYTYLRPGTRLRRGAKAGGFVEMKNADVGEDSKVPHLSYVGDATIGERTNIGAATVFVNYDGVNKHNSVIGDDVRVGSDTMLVAPITVGDGAYTAAGSVIVEDVPPGALAVGRAHQRNVEGWVEKRRPGSSSARAAARATSSAAEAAGAASAAGVASVADAAGVASAAASGADVPAATGSDQNGSPDDSEGDAS
jgi:bifunctional UDP-N-acetylglucosamine pyrophosphorylase/glucosamine-1-phosphate N-acetyltransferase